MELKADVFARTSLLKKLSVIILFWSVVSNK